MKKKILIALAIVAAIVIIGIGYIVVKDLKQEDKLKQELKEINKLANAQNINIDEINKRLESTITTGDYEIVEKAYKQYLKDSFDNSIQIATLLNDEKISDILTANNYTNDGPDFINTKQYLSETIEKLETCKEKYNEFFTEEKSMSYINDKNLDSYYIEFFKNEMMGDISTENQDKTVENAVNQVINLLKDSDKIIDFLISNKGNWQINGENIEFNSDKLADDYNNMLNSIKEEALQQ